ncbi:hypothetical protein ACH41H_45000 [Streptomyces sp. NPDC020800]|uniref:hypothetical protein n=1 Tax=Streptomyces sp. NPDC020800 TaxID=3365092 RepID=UPI00378A8402
MEPLPTPCPADLIPEVTSLGVCNAATRAAREQGVVWVGVERQGDRWTVKADVLTAPQHVIDDTAYDAVRTAVIQLIHSGEIRPDSSAGPAYFVLYDVGGEHRARELAAALHAALYGDLGPLARAMPRASS